MNLVQEVYLKYGMHYLRNKTSNFMAEIPFSLHKQGTHLEPNL